MSFVYLIEAEIGVVKIGCAERPEVRLAAVRTHSPVAVRLLAQWEGCRDDEISLHRRFVAQRTQYEWFRVEGPLLAFVAEVQGRGLDRIEPWDEVSFWHSEEKRERRARLQSEARKRHLADPAVRLELMLTHRIYRARRDADLERSLHRGNFAANYEALKQRIRDEVAATPKGRALMAELQAASLNQQARAA